MEFMQLLETVFSSNGLFATLCVGLIVWQSKTNQEREQRYIEMLNNVNSKIYDTMQNIQEDILKIKECVKKDCLQTNPNIIYGRRKDDKI